MQLYLWIFIINLPAIQWYRYRRYHIGILTNLNLRPFSMNFKSVLANQVICQSVNLMLELKVKS